MGMGSTGKYVVKKEDSGGSEAEKVRKERWKEINKEEQIRIEKYNKMLKELNERLKNDEEKTKTEVEKKIREVYKKVDTIMRFTMEQDAYNWFCALRVTDPEIYKKIFKIIIEPNVITNADSILRQLFKNAYSNPPKLVARIKQVTLEKYYRKLKGIQPEIRIDEKEKKKLI